MADLSKLLGAKTCVYCNFSECICPQSKQKSRIISSIKEVNVKSKKWVTVVNGTLDKQTFITLKKVLGTGGTCIQNCISLRGRIQNRVKSLLHKLGYEII
jgi:translation initiation factor 1 (eIF-1/SUI1)